MSEASNPRRSALVLLVLLTLVWGTNWPLFPLVLRELSVWTFRAVSMTAAGIGLLLLARARGMDLAVPRRFWGPVLGGGLIYLAIWNVAAAMSTVLIPSGQTAVLGFTMPLWAALIGWLAFGERLSGRQWLAVALGAAGVLLLVSRNAGVYAQAPLGVGLALLAAIGWALGTLVLKRSGVTVPALVLTGWQLLLASVPVTAGALWFGDGRWFLPSPLTIALVVYITIVPMALGNLLWFRIVGLLPATVAGLSSIMVPVVAMVSGALAHGEPLGPAQIAAMACCAAAMWLALRR